jgi:hypothetical protein
MDPAIGIILAAALSSASRITAALITRTAANDGNEKSLFVDIRRDRYQNKDFLRGVINGATKQLADMLRDQTKELVLAFQKQNLRNSVSDVQAHVKVLENLLNPHDIDSNVREEFVKTVLVPLEVSIHKVHFCDLEENAEEIRDACIITGLSSLLAGYGFLGQDPHQLREQLENVARNAQYRLLDSLTRKIADTNLEIPWERLPIKSPLEGAQDLAAVYQETIDKLPVCPFDLEELTVDEIRSELIDIHDLRILEVIRENEEITKNRIGVMNAIDSRVRKIEE